GLAVTGDRIVVADASNEVRVFDRAGAFVRSFGRTGEGPGEFTYLDALAFAPDGTLLARDSRLMRVTRFDTAGAVAGSFRLARPPFALERLRADVADQEP